MCTDTAAETATLMAVVAAISCRPYGALDVMFLSSCTACTHGDFSFLFLPAAGEEMCTAFLCTEER